MSNILDKIKGNMAKSQSMPPVEMQPEQAMAEWEAAIQQIPEEVKAEAEQVSSEVGWEFSTYEDWDIEAVMEMWPLASILEYVVPLWVISTAEQRLKFIHEFLMQTEEAIESLINE